jgi:hypothetical protein
MTNDFLEFDPALAVLEHPFSLTSFLIITMWIVLIFGAVIGLFVGLIKRYKGQSTCSLSKTILIFSVFSFFIGNGFLFWDWGMALSSGETKSFEMFNIMFISGLRCLGINLILSGIGICVSMIIKYKTERIPNEPAHPSSQSSQGGR